MTTRPPFPAAQPGLGSSCSIQSAFCSLSDDLRDTLEELKTSASYARGQAAFHESDPCHSVFFIRTGRMKLVTSSREGRGLLLRFAGPCEILGLAEAVLRQPSYQCSAIAAEPTVVAVIPSDVFMRFAASNSELRIRLTTALSEQYRLAQLETKFLAFGGTSMSRLAHLLLDAASERGDTEADGIHLSSDATHLELAQSIGTTRETVTRVLGSLNHSGILERTPTEFVIHGKEELQRLGTY